MPLLLTTTTITTTTTTTNTTTHSVSDTQAPKLALNATSFLIA